MYCNSTVAAGYETQAAAISETMDSLVNIRIMAGELETLRILKNNMDEFETQVDSIRRALMDILDNEEDLRLLYLTKVSLALRFRC